MNITSTNEVNREILFRFLGANVYDKFGQRYLYCIYSSTVAESLISSLNVPVLVVARVCVSKKFVVSAIQN